jgi:hypothetical protein
MPRYDTQRVVFTFSDSFDKVVVGPVRFGHSRAKRYDVRWYPETVGGKENYGPQAQYRVIGEDGPYTLQQALRLAAYTARLGCFEACVKFGEGPSSLPWHELVEEERKKRHGYN